MRSWVKATDKKTKTDLYQAASKERVVHRQGGVNEFGFSELDIRKSGKSGVNFDMTVHVETLWLTLWDVQ